MWATAVTVDIGCGVDGTISCPSPWIGLGSGYWLFPTLSSSLMTEDLSWYHHNWLVLAIGQENGGMAVVQTHHRHPQD